MISFMFDEKNNTTITRLDNGDWYNNTTELVYPAGSPMADFYERFAKSKMEELASAWVGENAFDYDYVDQDGGQKFPEPYVPAPSDEIPF